MRGEHTEHGMDHHQGYLGERALLRHDQPEASPSPRTQSPTRSVTEGIHGGIRSDANRPDGWIYTFDNGELKDDGEWEYELLVDSGAHTHVMPKRMTDRCDDAGVPGERLRSITGKGIRTWNKRVLAGEIYDHATSVRAKFNATPAEVRRGALSVAELNDAGYSMHFDPDGAKIFKSSDNGQREKYSAET